MLKLAGSFPAVSFPHTFYFKQNRCFFPNFVATFILPKKCGGSTLSSLKGRFSCRSSHQPPPPSPVPGPRGASRLPAVSFHNTILPRAGSPEEFCAFVGRSVSPCEPPFPLRKNCTSVQGCRQLWQGLRCLGCGLEALFPASRVRVRFYMCMDLLRKCLDSFYFFSLLDLL